LKIAVKNPSQIVLKKTDLISLKLDFLCVIKAKNRALT